ncbi:hypothetical protein MJO28_003623, partial [Puccinia striiformis f. sp. tritici]
TPIRLSYKYHTRHDLCPTANDATPFFFAAGLQQLDVKHENLQVDIPLMVSNPFHPSQLSQVTIPQPPPALPMIIASLSLTPKLRPGLVTCL